MFVGIDRLERLKAIPLKLITIDHFMSENPKWRGKIAFSIIGITAFERGGDYRQTLRDVSVMVNSLNEKYGDGEQLVYFEEKSEKNMTLKHRLAYLAASDVLMNTATR